MQVKTKFRYIDALRGIAVLAVIMVHCGKYGLNHYPDLFYSIINTGGRGVQLFFVASAFTLFFSLNNAKSTINQNYNFFIRRISESHQCII